LPPYSSMCGLHILADHGAWLLYIPSLLYKILPSVHWLFLIQALALSFCSLPLWLLSKQFRLSDTKSWLICILWWLQPVLFNVNLFDFHPEVLIIPVLITSYIASFRYNFKLWVFTLFIILGARDGLVLLVAGMSIEQLFRRNFLWSFTAISISIAWLIFLNNWVYPILNYDNEGILAIGNHFSYLGNSISEIIKNIIARPHILFTSIDLKSSLFYLLILVLPFILFWRKNSIITLLSCIPILIINILAESFSFRTLIHHYSLPLAAIGTIASIEGLSQANDILFTIRMRLIWISLCWGLLAKPGFFFDTYLSRIDSLKSAYQAINLVDDDYSVMTTSYLLPHLSQRKLVDFPRSINLNIDKFQYLLLNPLDPGWKSSKSIQNFYLEKAKVQGWKCRSWNKGLTLCSNK